MTTEPERTPPSGTGHAAARAVDLLTGRTGADACPAWLEYPLGPVETIAIPAAVDPADPNGPVDPWPEDRAAIRRAIATVLHAAREHGCLREDDQ